MKVWVMSAVSESCDHYDSCATWDHKPSVHEVAKVLRTLDCMPAKSKQHAEDLGPGEPFQYRGKWYANFCSYSIRESEVST